MSNFQEKLAKLRRRFRDLGSAVVAFSGGVDSAVLAKVARQELGDEMLAVTAKSPSTPARDFESAREFCIRHDIPHEVVNTDEFENQEFTANTADRCYHCKKTLYQRLIHVADENSFKVVVEGTNASDLLGHRPGYRASGEQDRVITPLIDCDINKEEVRAIARYLALGTVADKPATACLSSRIPVGTKLDPDVLKLVDRAEEIIREMGIQQVRVRHHGDLARIEVGEHDIGIAIEQRQVIDSQLRRIGYKYVTIDLKGYRPSSPV